MASILHRNGSWRALIRLAGHPPMSKTFRLKADAERWASKTEDRIRLGADYINKELSDKVLGDVLDKYADEVSKIKKGARFEISRIQTIKKHKIARYKIGGIDRAAVAEYKDDRLKAVTPQSVRIELAILSHVFTTAIKDWGYPIKNPLDKIRWPAHGKPRTTRVHAETECMILSNCCAESAAFFVIAIETGMRRSELHRVTTDMISGRVIHLQDTKNGTSRDVPLSKRACMYINTVMPAHGRIWTKPVDWYTAAFKAACKASGIDNTTLHDLRHEATTRFFERGWDSSKVSKVTGHKTHKMLARYTHLDAQKIADEMQ
jgi:integrase